MLHRTFYVEKTDEGFGIFQQTEMGGRVYCSSQSLTWEQMLWIVRMRMNHDPESIFRPTYG